MSLTDLEPICGTCKNTYKKEFLEKAEKETLWRNNPRMNHSKRFLQNFETASFKKYLDNSKNQLHLLTGFLTEHCRLRKSLMQMGLSNTDECLLCGEGETAIHVVTKNSPITSQRRQCFKLKYSRVEKLTTLIPLQILGFIKPLELECDLLKSSVRGQNRSSDRSGL